MKCDMACPPVKVMKTGRSEGGPDQRVYIKYGSGVETWYSYSPERRWLTGIKTTGPGRRRDLAKDLKKVDNADKELGRGIAPICNHLWGQSSHMIFCVLHKKYYKLYSCSALEYF
jgi:hypothetical protein